MIPCEKLEVGVHYWAYVKRNQSLAVVCLHRWSEPEILVKGTDPSIFNQHVEDYVFIAPCVPGADVFDEVSTLRINEQEAGKS